MARASARRAGRPRRDAGFTLLEMLVAVAILAVLAGLIPRSFVTARAIIDHSESWLHARLVAEAVLSEELSGMDLRPGTRQGVMEGRQWTATMQPNAAVGGASVEGDRILLDVLVTVTVSARHNLEVETMRIGAAQ